MIHVKPIDYNNKKERDDFIRFAFTIYEGNPNWVAPLWMDLRGRFSKKHPFFHYGELQLYMAFKDDKVVGRIAAIKNSMYNEHHQCKTGFVGYFECIDDQAVSDALFDTAKAWLQERGLNLMHGPASPSSNYDYGMLVDGFDDPPRVSMPYNPEYYIRLWENYGFEKAMGLFAYKVVAAEGLENPKLTRVAEIAMKRSKLTMRPINMKKIKQEIKIIKEIYNKGWESNYGFLPLTDAELDAMVAEFKLVADPNFIPILFNEKNEPIAMALCLPDINEITISFKGKLFPFNFINLLTKQKSIKWMRVLLLGILPEYRGRGIDAILYVELLKQALKRGIVYGEGSWILEDNPMMNRGMATMGAEIYKTYRIYEKAI